MKEGGKPATSTGGALAGKWAITVSSGRDRALGAGIGNESEAHNKSLAWGKLEGGKEFKWQIFRKR